MDNNETDHRCYECRELMTEEEWSDRHSNFGGEDVHQKCCLICKEKEAIKTSI